MVTGGTEGSHQYTRAKGDTFSHIDFYTKFKIFQWIHVQIDNKVTLSYLVKMEGTYNKDLMSPSK